MKRFNFLFILGIIVFNFNSGVVYSQLLLDNENFVEIRNLVIFKFSNKMVDLDKKEIYFQVKKIEIGAVKETLKTIKKDYGEFKLRKRVKSAHWGETLKMNKRTKKMVTIPKLSQIYQLEFKNDVPVENIIEILSKINGMEYAYFPKFLLSSNIPNDPLYSGEYKWAFDVIKAEDAWGVTKSSSSIKIGIYDYFLDSLVTLHEDLVGKVDYTSLPSGYSVGYHGAQVAGAAACATNNSKGIANV